MEREGYWGKVTSNIDWCEENYVVSPYVAEFYNTISNIPMFLLAFYGMIKAIEYRHDSCLAFAYFGLGIVFVGSTLFHMTLLYTAQLLDELPMLYGISVFIYVLNNPKVDFSKTTLALILTLACLFITALMAMHRDSPLPHHISYGVLVFVLTIRAYYVSTRINFGHSEFHSRINFALFIFMIGFACWLIDQNYCSFLKLHATWHILTGTGAYLWLQAAAIYRLHIKNQGFATKYYFGGILPFVVTNKLQNL